jgi:hypothetical protein
MDEVDERVEVLDERLRRTAVGIELPEPVMPEIELGEPYAVLVSSAWSWVDATRALKARKAYGGDGET